MIQEIEPYKLEITYQCREPEKEDRILFYFDRGVLSRSQNDLEFPQYWEVEAQLEKAQCVYLFSLNEEHFFLANVRESCCVEEFEYRKLTEIRGSKHRELIFVAATGWHLFCWYDSNRFCGRCGARTIQDKKERMLRCTCGNMIFPKIAPAVIVGICNGEQLLLTKYANRAYKRYALVAGFTEIGETVEETVAREVFEEVGLSVKNIRYYKSQPWGFDSNLLMGFFCDVEGSCEIRMEEEELSVAEWVPRQAVPDYGEGLSLTHEMMKMFREGKV